MYHRTNVTKPVKVDARKACTRCGGSGIYTTWHGACYRCGGSGTDPKPAKVWAFPIDWSDDRCAAFVAGKDAAKRAAADRRAAAAQAAEAARKAEAEAHPTMGAILAAAAAGVWVAPLAVDIVQRFVDFGYAPSAAQAEVVAREAARLPERAAKAAAEAAERAAAAPVPTGRVVIVGEVIARKVTEGDYGTVVKVMLRGEGGWRVWVTEPAAVIVEKGDTLRLTATVTASHDDPTMGFGSRPTKAEVIA